MEKLSISRNLSDKIAAVNTFNFSPKPGSNAQELPTLHSAQITSNRISKLHNNYAPDQECTVYTA
jgi:tRNA A37 methylthiotransferase MiaB